MLDDSTPTPHHGTLGTSSPPALASETTQPALVKATLSPATKPVSTREKRASLLTHVGYLDLGVPTAIPPLLVAGSRYKIDVKPPARVPALTSLYTKIS